MAMAIWWPLAAWLSPAAAWFVFFNAVVGAIALMSSGSASASAHQVPARRRLCRSGSSVLLDRLRSFSIFAVHPVAGGVATGAPIDGDVATVSASDAHFYCYGTREAEAAQVRALDQPERSPQAADAPAGETAASSAAPAPAENEHVAPVTTPPEDEQEEKREAEAAEEGAEKDESISLDEAYALAQRRRAQDQASAPPPASAAEATPATAWTTKPAKKAAAEGVSRRRRNKAEADALDGKAELNARAELFIRQFREDLKLQRLNSILSHAHALRSPTAAAR